MKERSFPNLRNSRKLLKFPHPTPPHTSFQELKELEDFFISQEKNQDEPFDSFLVKSYEKKRISRTLKTAA